MKMTPMEKEFSKHYGNLSPELQQATNWIIENIEYVNFLTGGNPMPPETLEKHLNCAHERNDFLAIALIIYQQTRNTDK